MRTAVLLIFYVNVHVAVSQLDQPADKSPQRTRGLFGQTPLEYILYLLMLDVHLLIRLFSSTHVYTSSRRLRSVKHILSIFC